MDGEEMCPSGGTGCGGPRPLVEAYSKYVREKWRCLGVRKGSHGMVEIKLLRFRRLYPFFKRVQKGFPGFS